MSAAEQVHAQLQSVLQRQQAMETTTAFWISGSQIDHAMRSLNSQLIEELAQAQAEQQRQRDMEKLLQQQLRQVRLMNEDMEKACQRQEQQQQQQRTLAHQQLDNSSDSSSNVTQLCGSSNSTVMHSSVTTVDLGSSANSSKCGSINSGDMTGECDHIEEPQIEEGGMLSFVGGDHMQQHEPQHRTGKRAGQLSLEDRRTPRRSDTQEQELEDAKTELWDMIEYELQQSSQQQGQQERHKEHEAEKHEPDTDCMALSFTQGNWANGVLNPDHAIISLLGHVSHTIYPDLE